MTDATAKPCVAAALTGVCVNYGTGEAGIRALDDVSLEVLPGQLTVLMGPSGSGKTTLLQVLGCLRQPTGGEVYIEGRKVSGLGERELGAVRRKQIGFVFQQYNLLPTLRAWENVAVTLELQGENGPHLEELSRDLLARFGLRERADAFPGELSGGQKQRVAIARSIIGGPRLILADEPTAALDGAAGVGVIRVMRDLAREHGRAIVIVTHDPRMESFADTVVLLEDGRITSPKPMLSRTMSPLEGDKLHAIA
ncbi:MAG TPA: ABC transporter ATP-binding protein [Candidatus Kryptonia bacterium]|nr:ABC transporter ATP-binding protein [Candidatus Kryptonia bacterium]